MSKERKCRKCGSYIPLTETIDGKVRNLQTRKFCLKCSPFGSHNTKPDDPSRKSKKHYNKYSEWTEEDRFRNKAQQYYYRQKRIKDAIAIKGGKCKICGYDKCSRALSFHHKNPKDKLFSIDTRSILSHKWEKVLQEIEKCELLCMNCHMEEHHNQQTSKYANYIKEKYDFDI